MALLPDDPRQQKKLLIGLLPLIALGAYWYLYHSKRREEISALEARVESLVAKNETARARAMSGGPELERRLALYERHIARLEELVPKSEEVPQLLYDMALRAQEHGVELARMRPYSSEPGAFYTLETYDIGVFGRYHNIGRFLTAVGSLPRIVVPFNISLEPRAGVSEDDPLRLQALFRIKTYTIPTPDPVPAGT